MEGVRVCDGGVVEVLKVGGALRVLVGREAGGRADCGLAAARLALRCAAPGGKAGRWRQGR